MMLTLADYLVVSAALVSAGILTMALKRNAIGILMGIELITQAGCLNLVAFNDFLPAGQESPRLDGQMFTLLIVVLSALQAALAVAIFFQLHKGTGSIQIDQPAPRAQG
jgi:NADH-quinone oxidoreductase subunit K